MSTQSAPVPSPGSGPLCEKYDVALLDLDGVVYIGATAVPGAVEALTRASARGMSLVFVTNNAARPPEEVARHLVSLGLSAVTSDVMTSAQGAAELLSGRVPPGAPIAAVGGPGVAAALMERGYETVDIDDPSSVAVVMGYGPDVSWRDLAATAYAVERGALFVATNTDRTFPTARGIAPGNGMLVESVVAATGKRPLVAGKPGPGLFRAAASRNGSKRPLVVGDRLDTDIEGAVAAEMDSLLVLTGVTSAREVVLAPSHRRPTYLAADLDGLVTAHPPVTHRTSQDGGSEPLWICVGWQARAVVDEGGCVIDVRPQEGSGAGPDGINAIRAACAAAWSAEVPVLDVVGLP